MLVAASLLILLASSSCATHVLQGYQLSSEDLLRGPPNASMFDNCITTRCDQNQCNDWTSGGNIAQWGFYNDPHCQNLITHGTAYIECPTNACRGTMMCMGPLGGLPATVYIKSNWGFDNGGELHITMGQNCPVGGSGGTVAIIKHDDACRQVNGINSDFGMSFFPCGGAPGARRAEIPGEEGFALSAKSRGFKKRDPVCRTFDIDPDQTKWNFNAFTPSRRVSPVVPCLQDAGSCLISEAEQWTETWTVSWEVSVGVNIGGFSASASVGGSYANSVSSTITVGHSVPAGQTGYVSATAKAVHAPGHFRDCDDGSEHDGWALIPSTQTYSVLVLS